MPRSRRTLLASLAGGFGVVGSVGVSLTDRPTRTTTDVESFQYDAANTGTTRGTTGPEVTDRWRADVWSTEGVSPVLVDDVVICSGRGNVAAFDRVDGTERWSVDIAHATGGTPAIEDGRVFAPTWNTIGIGVHALDAETGEQLWHARSDENVATAATAVGGVVYTGGGLETDRLVALDAETGDELWSVTFGEYVTTPAVVDDIVYVGSGGTNEYVALEADTGEVLWRYEADNRAVTGPTVVDDTVYVGLQDQGDIPQDDDGTLRALNADDGTERWRCAVGTTIFCDSVAVDDTQAYVASISEFDARLVAVDRHDGTVLWTSPGCETTPTVVDDTVYVGRQSDEIREGGDIVALETVTGSELWSVSVDVRDAGDVAYTDIRNTPVVADGVVYAQTHAGDLYALETR